MSRKSIEVRVMEFFETAPLGVATMVMELCRAKVKERAKKIAIHQPQIPEEELPAEE